MQELNALRQKKSREQGEWCVVWEHRGSKQKLQQEEWNVPSVVGKQQKLTASRATFSENADDSKDSGPVGARIPDEMATRAEPPVCHFT